ncbi:MAG: phage tail protein, partial [Bradymonadaceae bacterium]
LAGESMGLSMVQDRATTARDLVLEILRHIDGIIYVEPSIGLLTIKLVRFDYNAAGLPVLDSDSCTVKSFSRPSWGDTKNTIRVSYVDRADGFTEKTAQAQELASIEVQGGKVSVQEVAFRGFSNAQSAQRAAARALAGLAYPLASVTIEADRSAWSFRPGSVFRLVWPPLGIEGMICRVVRVGTGRLDSGKIEIEAMEDVFAVDWTGYSTPPSTGWVDPAGDVPDLTALTAFEAPYEIAKGLEGQSAHYAPVSVMAARGEVGVSMGYNVYSQSPDSGFIDPTWIVQLANPPLRRVPYFTPTATLAEDISELTDEIVLLPGPDCDRLASVNQMDFATGVNIMVIAVHSGPPTPIGQIHGSEFIAFRDVVRDEDGTIRLQVLARGCLDGPPHAHAAGTRVWFISYGSDIVRARTPEPGEDNPLVRVTYFLYRPYNNRGEQPIPFGVSSGDMQIHIRRSEYWHQSTDLRRSVWPYCPTDVRFNGESYPESITGELTVSWAHRNRLGTWSYENSGQTAEPEPGTVYDVLVYGELGTLIHTEADLTGTSWTYSEALEIAESGLGRLNDHLRVVITTRRGSYVHGVGGRSITWEFDRV